MRPPLKIPNVVNLKFPKIVQPYKGEKVFILRGKIYNKAGSYALKNFPEILKYVSEYFLEGQLLEGKIYLEDAMSAEDYENKKCSVTYENRLRNLRSLIMDRIHSYDKILDMPTETVYSTSELLNYYKDNQQGITIKDPNATYSWEEITEKTAEILLLTSREKYDPQKI